MLNNKSNTFASYYLTNDNMSHIEDVKVGDSKLPEVEKIHEGERMEAASNRFALSVIMGVMGSGFFAQLFAYQTGNYAAGEVMVDVGMLTTIVLATNRYLRVPFATLWQDIRTHDKKYRDESRKVTAGVLNPAHSSDAE